MTLRANEASPVLDPAMVVKNWGEGSAQLKINGKAVAWEKNFRFRHVAQLDGTGAVVWTRQESVNTLKIVLVSESR